jgi:hypothetical protein
MAQPTPYTRQYDLENDASDNPLQPVPGAHLDQEFDAVKITLDETLVNLALLQRDDGALTNGLVTVATLSADVKALMAAGEQIEGAWLTATAYGVGDVVSESSVAYFCLVAHTSGTFATDLAAGKWQHLTGVTLVDGSVTAAKLASNAVTTDKILNGNVTTDKLGADAVNGAKIADGAVDTEHLAAGAVETAKIADANVTNAKLASVAGFSLKGQLLGSAAAAPVDLTQGQVLAGLRSWVTPGHRLTLTTGLDVTVADVTGGSAGTVFWTPRWHNLTPIFDGTTWVMAAIGERSFVLDTTNNLLGKNYDFFLDHNAGTPRIVTGPAWTNDTTRSAAISRDATYGWYVNTSSMTGWISNNGGTVSVGAGAGLYLGTIRCTANGQTEDSAAKRFVWNMYNRVLRRMLVRDTTNTWGHNTNNVWRQTRNSATNQLEFVRGLDEDPIRAENLQTFVPGNAGDAGYVSLGLDSVTTPHVDATTPIAQPGVVAASITATLTVMAGIGRHYIAGLDRNNVTAGLTWYGDNGTSDVFHKLSAEVMA